MNDKTEVAREKANARHLVRHWSFVIRISSF
jgi:hypothetical protein